MGGLNQTDFYLILQKAEKPRMKVPRGEVWALGPLHRNGKSKASDASNSFNGKYLSPSHIRIRLELGHRNLRGFNSIHNRGWTGVMKR